MFIDESKINYLDLHVLKTTSPFGVVRYQFFYDYEDAVDKSTYYQDSTKIQIYHYKLQSVSKIK